MEPSSPSTLNGPRPLATKPEYIRRLYTSKAGLLTPTSSNSFDIPELEQFDFKRPVDESLLQPNAKRAKKIYRSILRDQHFLLDLKHLWEDKLKQLQVEHMLLSQMCNYTQEDVNDLPPLFSQPPMDISLSAQQRNRISRTQPQRQDDREHLPVLHTVRPFSSQTDSSSSHNVDSPADSDTRIRSEVESGLHTETALSTAAQQRNEDEDQIENDTNQGDAEDGYFINSEGEYEEDDDYDIVEEEDEETARKALTFMLANYGTDL